MDKSTTYKLSKELLDYLDTEEAKRLGIVVYMRDGIAPDRVVNALLEEQKRIKDIQVNEFKDLQALCAVAPKSLLVSLLDGKTDILDVFPNFISEIEDIE